MEIYRSLENKENSNAFTLIRQAIELQFTRKIDITSINKTANTLKDNIVCMRILKEIIVQHVYMFPVDYKEKQQLAALLNISVQGQLVMSGNKKGKF
ncbi:MAG: hypothetical protein H7839_00225 [Magnetococcus sp. YQC-5]